MSDIPVISLHGDKSLLMPKLGMGTAGHPKVDDNTAKLAFLDAIRAGYRHFDTAPIYQTEQALGDAIAEALSSGLVKSRDELFIKSKLWTSDSHQGLVIPALKKSLRNLKLEYLDLYLIHWPLSSTPGFTFPVQGDDVILLDYKSVWSDMEECQKSGLTKSIGVSNFSCKKLGALLEVAKVPPAVNQVEMNPVWQQKKLMDFCKANKVILEAYSPLGAKGTPWGTSNVMDCKTLQEIAELKGKSVAQISLRWVYEQGVCLVVKSFDHKEMRENLCIFDWELTQEETEKISHIPQIRGFPSLDFVSPNGPIKTAEDLWDEDGI